MYSESVVEIFVRLVENQNLMACVPKRQFVAVPAVDLQLFFNTPAASSKAFDSLISPFGVMPHSTSTILTSVRAILVEQIERTTQSSKADIERFIEESKEKLASLELQISTLVELRDRERACVDSLRYIISPIRTLPIELLVEIFELAINDKTHIGDVHRISQVCLDWRKVAHSTPRLWTRPIYIDLKVYGGQGQLYADGLEAWLARSAPLPVSVSLMLLEDEQGDDRILEHVLRIAPRLHSLHCPNLFPLSIMSRLAECRLDSLEELEVGLFHSDPNISHSPALITAPRLRKSNLIILAAMSHIFVPWVQLTHLTLRCDSPDFILDIVAHCTTLIHASISGTYFDSPISHSTRPRLALNHLRTLSLEFPYPRHVLQILASVSASALEEFHLDSLEMQVRMQLEVPLTAFLMRSPNITRLRMDCGSKALASHEMIVVLENTPRLTHLHLACPWAYSLDDTLLEALLCRDGVAPLVPHLHSLVLDNINEDGFATDALENLFLSRWADSELMTPPGAPAVARWSRLVLLGEFSENFVDSMEMLRRKGLPLDLN
ncbi:hypothetical protein C8R45DRAFT_1079510 [Mycena sanguinolenta]|nr:hypothetical protein C8R45DRAFT_1079510 [Mycena sanguinolenta]